MSIMSIWQNTTNRIQTIENNREINHENGAHLPLKCAILKLELEIGKRFCKASANDPAKCWVFVFLAWSWPGQRFSALLPASAGLDRKSTRLNSSHLGI